MPPKTSNLVWGPVWSLYNTHSILMMSLNTLLWLKIKTTCLPTKSLQSCPTVCDPMDCSPPVSSVHGILQTRILEWVVMLSFRVSSQPRDWTPVSCIAGGFFTSELPGKPNIAYTVLKIKIEILMFSLS